jgi:serine/threonine-protein kinase
VKLGTTIERYVILERLGEGGMASVYLARHSILGSRHALKVLRPELANDAALRGRFLAEGRIAAQVRHPNVIDVTDVVIAPGIAGLVMEYIEGPTVDQWIDARQTPCSLDELLTIALPVLDGLAEAHAYGVVHRDLKPANIVLGRDRRGAIRPVVLDFGIAKLGEDTRVQHQTHLATQIGTRMGTPAYMSPEQIRESASVDVRTDVFACGAILYELATGHLAFAKDNEYDTMQAIVDGQFISVQRQNPSVPAHIADAIHRALATSPDDRFPDCASLAAALVGPVRTVRRAKPAVVADPKPTAPPPSVKAPPPAPRRVWHGDALLRGNTVLPLAGAEASCGRSPDCDIVVDDPSVNPVHCVFAKDRGRWGVTDARSTLGTLVDGSLVVGRTLLKPGQTLTVGRVDLVFREA